MTIVSNATQDTATEPLNRSRLLQDAVHQSGALSVDGALERLFTFAFRNLVYAQIWEDPIIDMQALELNSDSRMVAIASGGCNVLSYLTARPAHITAVDLNGAHVALNKLKLVSVQRLPDHARFHRFFAGANDRANVADYQRYVRPNLDAATKIFWDSRDLTGRRQITRFRRNVYHSGLLGRFIAAAHLVCRMHGSHPARMVGARSLPNNG